MPCSGCGGTGHNIRTCSQGPTPGGVNAMRARSSVTSNYSYNAASYLTPTTLFGVRESSYSNDFGYNAISCRSSVDKKFEQQIANIQGQYNDRVSKEAESVKQLVKKIGSDSRHTEEVLLNELEMAKRDTLNHIDNKFKAISQSFARVENKTIENQQNIQKNADDIHEIKKILVHLVENNEKQQKINSFIDEKDTKNSDSDDDEEEEELLSSEEMLKLSLQLIKSLKKCHTKKDQFRAITAVALKFANKEE